MTRRLMTLQQRIDQPAGGRFELGDEFADLRSAPDITIAATSKRVRTDYIASDNGPELVIHAEPGLGANSMLQKNTLVSLDLKKSNGGSSGI